jgi:hypothetical protein
MVTFKGVLVSRKSDLATALESGNRKEAEKVFSETTARYKALYSKEDREWFAKMSQGAQEDG